MEVKAVIHEAAIDDSLWLLQLRDALRAVAERYKLPIELPPLLHYILDRKIVLRLAVAEGTISTEQLRAFVREAKSRCDPLGFDYIEVIEEGVWILYTPRMERLDPTEKVAQLQEHGSTGWDPNSLRGRAYLERRDREGQN